MSVTTVTVDPRRLARALYLTCERKGSGLYCVSGGAESHRVQMGKEPSCDCTDFAVRGGPCKHLLRVMLAQGDAEIIEALQLLIPYPSQRRDRTATPA